MCLITLIVLDNTIKNRWHLIHRGKNSDAISLLDESLFTIIEDLKQESQISLLNASAQDNDIDIMLLHHNHSEHSHAEESYLAKFSEPKVIQNRVDVVNDIKEETSYGLDSGDLNENGTETDDFSSKISTSICIDIDSIKSIHRPTERRILQSTHPNSFMSPFTGSSKNLQLMLPKNESTLKGHGSQLSDSSSHISSTHTPNCNVLMNSVSDDGWIEELSSAAAAMMQSPSPLLPRFSPSSPAIFTSSVAVEAAVGTIMNTSRNEGISAVSSSKPKLVSSLEEFEAVNKAVMKPPRMRRNNSNGNHKKKSNNYKCDASVFEAEEMDLVSFVDELDLNDLSVKLPKEKLLQLLSDEICAVSPRSTPRSSASSLFPAKRLKYQYLYP